MPNTDAVAERDRLVELVDRLSLLAASPLPFEDLIQALVDSVMHLTRATGCVLEIQDGDALVYRNATGSVTPFVGLRIPRDSSLSGLCVARGQVMYTADAHDDSRVNLGAAQRINARSMMVVPLLYGREPLGALKSVSSAPNAFDRVDESALTFAARFIAGLLMRHVSVADFARPR